MIAAKDTCPHVLQALPFDSQNVLVAAADWVQALFHTFAVQIAACASTRQRPTVKYTGFARSYGEVKLDQAPVLDLSNIMRG